MCKVKRSIIYICLLCLLILSACSDSGALFKSDFKTGQTYLFHGLKPGITESELCKKENISSDTWKNAYLSDMNGYRYLETDSNLYGFHADKSYNRYMTYQGKYYHAETVFFFTNEKAFMRACKKLSNFLEKSYGMPDYNQINNGSPDEDNKEPIPKEKWDMLKNPPDLLQYVKDGGVELTNEEQENVPTFWWGNNQKGTALKVVVYRNPLSKSKIEEKYKYSEYAYSFIEITVFDKADVQKLRKMFE